MANATLTSAAALLKEIYEGPMASQRLLQLIESTNDGVTARAGGKYVDFPIMIGRNQGLSFRQEMEALGDPYPNHRSTRRTVLRLRSG